MNQDLKTILKSYNIPVTKNRLIILNTFIKANRIISQKDLLNKSHPALSRVSVFRNLNLFTEKGIILRIPGADRINRYVLQEDDKTAYSYFICRNCKKVILIKTIAPARVKLPKGYSQQNMMIWISGICKTCKN